MDETSNGLHTYFFCTRATISFFIVKPTVGIDRDGFYFQYRIVLTVRLTSIYNPQIKTNSPRLLVGSTNLFMVARTSLSSELVLATIKKVMAPLEVGPEFALI